MLEDLGVIWVRMELLRASEMLSRNVINLHQDAKTVSLTLTEASFGLSCSRITTEVDRGSFMTSMWLSYENWAFYESRPPTRKPPIDFGTRRMKLIFVILRVKAWRMMIFTAIWKKCLSNQSNSICAHLDLKWRKRLIWPSKFAKFPIGARWYLARQIALAGYIWVWIGNGMRLMTLYYKQPG